MSVRTLNFQVDFQSLEDRVLGNDNPTEPILEYAYSKALTLLNQ